MNLRELVEADLSDTLESVSDWGLPIVLISPDGERQSMKKGSPQSVLSGQVLYDTQTIDPETGLEITVHKPAVVLRISSLDRIPQSGEAWAVQIPETPAIDASLVTFILEQPVESGESIGFIKLYLTKAEQQI